MYQIFDYIDIHLSLEKDLYIYDLEFIFLFSYLNVIDTQANIFI